ncbi:MAG: family 10 glycosylhydrolase [Planctomycetota bacterium]
MRLVRSYRSGGAVLLMLLVLGSARALWTDEPAIPPRLMTEPPAAGPPDDLPLQQMPDASAAPPDVVPPLARGARTWGDATAQGAWNPLDANPAVRAVWADAFHSGFKSTSQIDNLVARAVTGRYNMIIAEVLAFHDTAGSGHGAYWNSAYVPRATDISGGLDPLAYLITKAHAAGIQVQAWLVSYRICDDWPPAGNSFLAARPQWCMVTRNDLGGGPAPVAGHYTFDPGCPEVQQHLVNIVREIVTNYAVDGINLDYIRYLQTDGGYPADANFAAAGLARYRRLTGDPGTPGPTGVPAWDEFRRQSITELVRRLRAEIPLISSNPRQPVWLTADLICFGNAPAVFENSDAYMLFQNWRAWMEDGLLDAGIPMNYKREWRQDQATWYRNWVNASLTWSYARHMVSGQANYLNPKADSVTQMRYALDVGCDGTCNYSYYATADENMDGTWENDWTWYSYVAQNLFTSAAAVPALPWRDPNAAIEGTLYGRVLDARTQQPVDGASVTVAGRPAVFADGNGYYAVTMVPAAPGGTAYTVTVRGAGCPDLQVGNVLVWPGVVAVRDFGLCGAPRPGDMDLDGDIDFQDYNLFAFCLIGPDRPYGAGHTCRRGDFDLDADVDLGDAAEFQLEFGTP